MGPFRLQKLREILICNVSRSLSTSKCQLRSSNVSDSQSPLSGIRILDLTRIVAGPYCTMLLGDLGADVLKVERLHTGDEARKWGPPFRIGSTESGYFISLNRNKRSICVDFKSATGRQVMYDLVEKCDVLVENYVPGKLSEMKLGYEHLKEINPRLIYCSVTGHGSSGPYAKRMGYDLIAASMGGLLHITGPEGGEPVKVGVAATDMATGLFAHGAIMAALLKRSRTNRGQKIDCDLLSTQVAQLISVGSNYLNAGVEAQRWGTGHESIVPYEAFPTKSGYLTVGAATDKQFEELCKILNIPDLSEDERFKTNKLRVANRKVLIKILRDIFITKENKEWLYILKGAPFPHGPINTLAEVFDDPHIKAIGLVKEMPHPAGGSVKMVGPSVVYSEGGNTIRLAPPMLGQHTSEILTEIVGYTSKKVDELKRLGTIQ